MYSVFYTHAKTKTKSHLHVKDPIVPAEVRGNTRMTVSALKRVRVLKMLKLTTVRKRKNSC